MSDRELINSGSKWEDLAAYSRAVVIDDEWIFMSGCTGYEYSLPKPTLPADIISQTEQCFLNISSALQQAGAEIKDIVRVKYILPDRKEFAETWPVLRKWLGEVRPAATMMQAGLVEEEMRIEVEVTAKKPRKRDEKAV